MRTEAHEGIKRDILVPVLIEIVEPPIAFRMVQAADLTDWKGEASTEAFTGLLDSITHVIGSSEEAGLDFQAQHIQHSQLRQGASVKATPPDSTPPDMVRIHPGPLLFGEYRRRRWIGLNFKIDIPCYQYQIQIFH